MAKGQEVALCIREEELLQLGVVVVQVPVRLQYGVLHRGGGRRV
jgi:hypothetical protein